MKKIILLLIFSTLNSCTFTSSRIKDVFFKGTFLKIEKKISLTACHPLKPSECITKRFESSASSFLIMHQNKKSYLMTAAHVCHNDYGKLVYYPGFKTQQEFYGLTLKMEKHYYKVEAMDFESDLCIVSTDRFEGVPYKIAQKLPEIGEQVYNIAAPAGIFEENLAPLFKGLFSGGVHGRKVYTLPATGGSSGSPILNRQGQVIGVVSAVTKNFKNIVISPTLKQIKNIIKTINK